MSDYQIREAEKNQCIEQFFICKSVPAKWLYCPF